MDQSHPALFISHGSPMLAVDQSPAHVFLKGLAAELPRPKDILVVSAHWETDTPTVSLSPRPETIYDFGGFARELYEIRYPAAGAVAAASRTAELLEVAGFSVRRDPERGLDHGAWVPLSLIYPKADIPVTQLSIQPKLGPEHHFRIGRALRPLREEGTLVIATGAITHSLEDFFKGGYGRDAAPPDWVTAFADWLADAINNRKVDDLLNYRELAPFAVRNHPTEEHLLPLFVALGAASDVMNAERLHASCAYGVIAMDTYVMR